LKQKHPGIDENSIGLIGNNSQFVAAMLYRTNSPILFLRTHLAETQSFCNRGNIQTMEKRRHNLVENPPENT